MSEGNSARGRGGLLSLILRLLVTGGVIALLLARINVTHIGRALGRINTSAVWWSLGICVLANIIATCRWQTLLHAVGVKAGWGFAAEATIIGLFMNTVTPSNIGQDVWRVMAVQKRYGRGAAGLATVGADRVAGLSGAALLPLLALGPAARVVGLTNSLIYTSIPLVGLLLGLGIARTELARRWGAVVLSVGPLRRIRPHIRYVYHSLYELAADRKAMLLALTYGVAFHVCVVWANYTLARGLGLSIPFTVCLVVVPLAVIVQAIPITINGLGIREGAYVSLFGAAGIKGADAVAVSLLFFGVGTALSMCGAIPLLTHRRRVAPHARP